MTILIFIIGFSNHVTIHAQHSEKPNVIIFLTDDQGYGDLASYGHPFLQTPHLDKFAEQGVRMTDMHSAATVCSPSRAALLTGRNAFRSGYYYIARQGGISFPKDEITIAHLLKDSGYDTAYFGKWHLSSLESDDEVSVNETGFDYSFATSRNAFDGPAPPKNPGKFVRNGEPVGQVEGWYIDIIVEDATKWVEGRADKEKPFFMIIATHEPHTAIAPPEKYAQLYDNERVDEMEKEIKYGGVPRPPRDILKYKKEYYGTITQIDDAFGDLMQFIDKQGLQDNTLVVFTSDNGPEYPNWEPTTMDKSFGTPGNLRGMKRFAYEGGHRVPGLARWPGHIPAGIVSDKLFNGTDFLPTISHIAGANIPTDRTIDGVDAFNAFLNKDYQREHPPMWFWPATQFVAFPAQVPEMGHISMRYGDYSLIGWLTPARSQKNQFLDRQGGFDWIKTAVPATFELYNLKEDVEQNINLADLEYETLIKLIPIMQRRWIDIRDDGPWWGRE